jgi:ABC-2 type transport system ATP-binding protein
MKAIETYGLTKIYTSNFGKRKIDALVDLNLSIERGMIFGLLGPNGAGKTTLIKLLLRITFPTSGTAKILEEEISNYKIKSGIGYLPENHKYPPYLKGEEVLKFFGKLSGLEATQLKKRTNELLELVKLSKDGKRRVKTYSKGMMQRLGLAQALINDPELLFLDEPTDGVDPIGRKEIRDILSDLRSKGKTIFLNSHLLSEVELITDKVAILNKGRLLREGSVRELTEKKEEYNLSIDDSNSSDLKDIINGNSLIRIKEGEYTLKVSDVFGLNKVIDQLRNNGVLIKQITKQKNTLEEMFVSLIASSEKEGVK